VENNPKIQVWVGSYFKVLLNIDYSCKVTNSKACSSRSKLLQTCTLYHMVAQKLEQHLELPCLCS